MRFTIYLTLILLASTPVSVAQDPLAKELGAAMLRVVGSAKERGTAEAVAAMLREELSVSARHALLRFGLRHADDRVVFGAILFDEGKTPYPEIRHAAAIAIARLGDPDCPLGDGDVLDVMGSVDVPAMLARIPDLDEGVAAPLISHAHRLMRAEHVPALCELALRSSPEVSKRLLEVAEMVANFSDEHLPLVAATTLQLAGRVAEPADSQLPPTLRAMLELIAENSLTNKSNRDYSYARWLDRSEVGAADVPLLERLLQNSAIKPAALRALGRVADPRATELLETHAEDLSAQYSLARCGDSARLEALLHSTNSTGIALGLDAASPERRRRFAADLLALPVVDALEVIATLAELAQENTDPESAPYEDAWFSDLEPLAAAAVELDARVLRALVAAVPVCASGRLADRLLAAPLEALFAPEEEAEEVDDWTDRLRTPYSGDLGFQGVWAFLEVTRPAEFRKRLREGLNSVQVPVRDLCGTLLALLLDRESGDQLGAWALDLESREQSVPWLHVAACGGAVFKRELLRRLYEIDDEDEVDEEMRTLFAAYAVAIGMPLDVALTTPYEIYATATLSVRTYLLTGMPARAWLEMQADAEEESLGSWSPELALWMDPEIQHFVAEQRGSLEFADQLILGAIAGDAVSRGILRELCLDGRYASHHDFKRGKAADRDLSMLKFWIDESGTNCCRFIDSAAHALKELFGARPEHAREQAREPLVTRMRKNLLSRQDRLRWSTIANGYVVAGN